MTFEELCEAYAETDGFMEPEIVRGEWVEVDGPCGVDAIPAEYVSALTADGVRDYTENREIWSIEKRSGYGARFSAPGYMDCTEWSVFDTLQEAVDYLAETYLD
jgi:hypothetical protein